MLIHEIPEGGWAKLGEVWFVRCPGQRYPSALGAAHYVEEHDDGSITVTPSLLIHDHSTIGAKGWHGWLTKGEFHS